MSLSNKQLMHLAAGVLFTHDERGRIVQVNEPDGDVAPRFYLGRTSDGNIWRVRHDLPEAVVEELEALARSEPIPHDLREPPTHLEAFKRLWRRTRRLKRQEADQNTVSRTRSHRRPASRPCG